jgi:hypothetical protein
LKHIRGQGLATLLRTSITLHYLPPLICLAPICHGISDAKRDMSRSDKYRRRRRLADHQWAE